MTAPCTTDYQGLIQQLVTFSNERFGAYLDMKMGFEKNLREIESRYQSFFLQTDPTVVDTVFKNTLPIDDQPFIRWGMCSNQDYFLLSDYKPCVIHQMTVREFKENNKLGGMNHNFAIENCITDIFNYWKIILKDFKVKIRTQEVFPIMEYLGLLRNRVQHDLYGKRIVTQKVPIEVKNPILKYPFPVFKPGDYISLTDRDIQALVLEIREQLTTYLLPSVTEQASSA